MVRVPSCAPLNSARNPPKDSTAMHERAPKRMKASDAPERTGRGNSVARSAASPFTRRVCDLSPVVNAELIQARGHARDAWKDRAAAAARSRFGRYVFVRAVVEVSNFCRENCAYCGMRRDNRALDRFRAAHDTLAEVLIHGRPGSVTDVNIQGGEDPLVTRQVVLPLIRTLRRETSLGVSVCLGTLNPSLYSELHEAGASTY